MNNRFLIATIVITVFALAWNGLVHLVILEKANSTLVFIARPDSLRPLWLALLAKAAVAVLFVSGYRKIAREGTVTEGLAYGAVFGILAGVLVDLNQYIIYPIPAGLALSRFVFGFVEFSIYGVLVSLIYPVKAAVAESED